MHKPLIILIIISCFFSGYANSRMVPTEAVISDGTSNYSQQQLLTALASSELRDQLSSLGVDPSQLDDRVSSLTPAEIAHLNSELEREPAGGIIGVLLTIFIVFVITDMLCATDIFGFVKCINK